LYRKNNNEKMIKLCFVLLKNVIEPKVKKKYLKFDNIGDVLNMNILSI